MEDDWGELLLWNIEKNKVSNVVHKFPEALAEKEITAPLPKINKDVNKWEGEDEEDIKVIIRIDCNFVKERRQRPWPESFVILQQFLSMKHFIEESWTRGQLRAFDFYRLHRSWWISYKNVCLKLQDSWEDDDEEEKKDEEKVAKQPQQPKLKPKKSLQAKLDEKEVSFLRSNIFGRKF